MGLVSRIQVWLYDLIKTVITAILVIMIIIMLLRWNAPASRMSAAETMPSPTPVAQSPTATPVPAPTATAMPPVIIGPPSLDLPDRGLEAGEIELVGNAPGADQIQIVIDGRVIDTVDVGPDGAWSLSVALDDPGEHEIVARALDDQGAFASETTRALTLESGLIPLEVGVPVWGEWAPVDAQRSRARLELSGQGAPGASVLIRADDDPVATIQVGGGGAWAFVEDVTQTPGPHKLYVDMQNARGELLGAAEPIPFVVPTPAPTPTPVPTPVPTPSVPAPAIVFPQKGDVLRAGPVGIRGTGESGIEIEVLSNAEVSGAAPASEDGAWRVEVELAEGQYALTARVVGVEAAASEPVQVLVVRVEEVCALVAPPSESRCPADPPVGQDRGDSWVVAECETLGLIARRAGVSLAEILAVNPEVCNPNLIFAGQVLKLPLR